MSGITVENAGNDGIEVGTSGSATLTHVTLKGNGRAGVSSRGAALTIALSTIGGNGDDGVLENATGVLHLTSSTLDGNGANGVEDQGASGGTLTSDTVSNSTLNGVLAAQSIAISSSTISGSGSRGVSASGGATLTNDTVSGSGAAGVDLDDNSTITGTTVSGGSNRGIWSEGGTLNLTNSTVVGNNGDGMTGEGSTVTLVNDTIAGNLRGLGVETQVNVENTIVDGSCDRTPDDLGHNLENGTSCGFVLTNDIQSTDPLLGALANNGGSTQTEALDPSSAAVDAGDDAACPALDQRGTSRPQGAHCDIGAFELVQSGGAGPVSASVSTVAASPHSVAANGISTATVTVTLRDGSSNPVAGKTVSLGAGSGSSTIVTVSGTTNASGVATFKVKDATVQSVTYTATDTTDSVAVTQAASVSFTAAGGGGGGGGGLPHRGADATGGDRLLHRHAGGADGRHDRRLRRRRLECGCSVLRVVVRRRCNRQRTDGYARLRSRGALLGLAHGWRCRLGVERRRRGRFDSGELHVHAEPSGCGWCCDVRRLAGLGIAHMSLDVRRRRCGERAYGGSRVLGTRVIPP